MEQTGSSDDMPISTYRLRGIIRDKLASSSCLCNICIDAAILALLGRMEDTTVNTNFKCLLSTFSTGGEVDFYA